MVTITELVTVHLAKNILQHLDGNQTATNLKTKKQHIGLTI
jgi:hypothetical protein